MYPFCSSSYVTVLCLFYHHMWNGTFLIIGGGAHASIREIREAYLPICINSLFTAHRDVIIGHLIWVSIYLGFHSFSLYIHNDTFQALIPSISGYSFIFISAHFIWAFSLMFLYSGRGYWQELIESILWAHHKLKIMPHIQPRALSISQGRAVGFIHYILGGILSTWAFIISRMVVID